MESDPSPKTIFDQVMSISWRYLNDIYHLGLDWEKQPFLECNRWLSTWLLAKDGVSFTNFQLLLDYILWKYHSVICIIKTMNPTTYACIYKDVLLIGNNLSDVDCYSIHSGAHLFKLQMADKLDSLSVTTTSSSSTTTTTNPSPLPSPRHGSTPSPTPSPSPRSSPNPSPVTSISTRTVTTASAHTDATGTTPTSQPMESGLLDSSSTTEGLASVRFITVISGEFIFIALETGYYGIWSITYKFFCNPLVKSNVKPLACSFCKGTFYILDSKSGVYHWIPDPTEIQQECYKKFQTLNKMKKKPFVGIPHVLCEFRGKDIAKCKESYIHEVLRRFTIQYPEYGEINQPCTITDPSLPDNPVVYVNNAFTKLTGYSKEEILGF
eukprot:TRINITY_DN27444_c0_g1_i1.p1 TRINITY_DN27444_c0_g1~~TRINITY_DN27444_c0_g1_i1.p1  ORF type:complete len:381 (+),score=63.06 TRINITY_DN27444_c0_g1_i1:64-1206(+)